MCAHCWLLILLGARAAGEKKDIRNHWTVKTLELLDCIALLEEPVYEIMIECHQKRTGFGARKKCTVLELITTQHDFKGPYKIKIFYLPRKFDGSSWWTVQLVRQST